MRRTWFFAVLIMPFFCGPHIAAQGISWIRTTLNGPAMGGVVSLAQLPSGEILAGTYSRLYVSSDDGNTWIEKGGGLPGQPIFSIFPLPTGITFLTTNGRLYRSTDRGENWTIVATGFDWAGLRSVSYNPTAGLFVGTSNGVLRSTNNGGVWFWANTGLDNPYVRRIYFDSFGGVYASTSASWNNKRLYRSTNNGGSWTSISTHWVDAMAFACQPSGTIYIGTAGFGVERSTDFGGNWESLNSGLEVLGVSALAVGGGDTIFASTAQFDGPSFYRSTNGGESWLATNSGITETYIRCVLETQAGHLFIGVENAGIFRSRNRAADWIAVSTGMTAKTVRSLLATPSGKLVVGTEGDGVFLSSDKGETWDSPSGIGLKSVWTIVRDSSGNLFAGASGGIYRSTDHGSEWTGVYNPPADSGNWVSAITATSNGVLFAAVRGHRLLRSLDAGVTWQTLTNTPTDRSYTSLAVTLQNVVLVGTTLSGVHRSTDSGDSWLPADSLGGVCPPNFYCLLADRANNVFAGGQFTCPPPSSLYKSGDQGSHWSACQMPSYVMSIASNSRGYVYIGVETAGGVFQSRDTGATWEPVGPLNATALDIDPEGILFAGGGQGNLFRTIGSTTDVNERYAALPYVSMLYQNYPNPFNPTTTIKFQIQKITHVTLKVFDLLGREVATLVDQKMEPGTHERVFNAEALATGMYLYQLKSGGFVQTRKLLLLR